MGSFDESLNYTTPFQLTPTIHRKVYDLISPTNPDNAQPGKIVVITGGGSGIGAAAARVWVQAGAEGVVIAGRRKNVLDDTAVVLEKLAQGKTKIVVVPTDITIESDMQNLLRQVKSKFGRPADVVIANAGTVSALKPLAEESVDTWWNVYEINTKGLHNTVRSFIQSQPDLTRPQGTIINISSGLAGIKQAGFSAYCTSKMASSRYMEFVQLEYPSLRAFTMLPGVVMTDLVNDVFKPYAKDEAELTGALALYLAQPKADYLKGSVTSVNWDVEEMELRKKEIDGGKVLQTSWVPILPCSGGSGF